MMTPFPLARARLPGAGLLLVAWLPGWAAAAGLNDTGITQCANATKNDLSCPQAGFPSQDAEVGRDAQQTAGTLTKVGGGSAGFDFTKLDANGNPLPASATAWDCVRDNVTGLIWEIKTDDNGLRDKDRIYVWCNNNAATNGGYRGLCDTENCSPNPRCDTEKFVQDVNALNPKLCGFSDWRMPTVEELQMIVDYSRKYPAIDTTAPGYFPRTVNDLYWSASPYAANVTNAWIVSFFDGALDIKQKVGFHNVRLVRGGQ